MKTDATVADGLTDRRGDIHFLASLSWGFVLEKEQWKRGKGLVLDPSIHHQSHFTDEEAEPRDHLDTVAFEFSLASI